MRALFSPACGAVQELCMQILQQCRCLSALQLAQQQCGPLGSSSSSSSQRQHPPQQQLQQQRGKHTVRMVLLKDHEHLGSRGDIVEVRAGHARQILFPKGQADYAVPSVLQQLKARGVLSQQGLQQLQPGSKARAAAGPVDPSRLPPEQQLPQIIKLLSSTPLVVSRRFSRRQSEQAPMVGVVTAWQLSLYVAKQLHVQLPRELIMMEDGSPITQFGSYRVPLNLRDEQGQQVELSVQVNKTYRAPGLRRIKLWGQQEGLLPIKTRPQRRPQQQQQQQTPGAADGAQQSLPEPQQQPSA